MMITSEGCKVSNGGEIRGRAREAGGDDNERRMVKEEIQRRKKIS